MDKRLTQRLQAWLDTPPAERDYAAGALLLLQLSGNRVQYATLAAAPRRHADFIEYHIRKYMRFRLSEVTHAEVVAMERQVAAIPALAEREPQAFRAGRRDDHDHLPPEVQALYAENADLMRRMRELHLRLRTLTPAEATCPDSDRYPFLRELIRLDKQYHDNWRRYDTYQPAQAAREAEQQQEAESRAERLRLRKRFFMTAGRYRKRPTEPLAHVLRTLAKELGEGDDAVAAALKELGL